QKSQNVPEITRDVESEVHAAALDAIARFETEQTEPLRAEPQGHACARRGPPRGGHERLRRPAGRGVRREGDRSRGPRRSRAEADEWHRHTPLDMNERGPLAAPFSEFVAEQCRAPAQDEDA